MGTAPSDGGETTGSGDGASTPSESGQAAGSTAESTANAATAGSDDSAADSVGQTRVYTPPEDAEDVPPDAVGESDGPVDAGRSGDAVKNEFCPICGETYEAGAGHSNCPNCNAVLDHE
jgi:hypothetical protein